MADGLQIIWTPWNSLQELLAIRAWLFPNKLEQEDRDSDMRRLACDQISAWKLRGNLPHAVESTWLLTEAILSDEISGNLISVFALKATHLTAISRFVTGLLDSQQDSKYKVSMYAKAQQLGLPAMFVDMRHEATHGEMPSLATLHNATQRAMQWLWDDYWRSLGEGCVQSQDREFLRKSDLRSSAPDHSADTRNLSMVSDAEDAEQSGHEMSFEPSRQAGGWRKWQGGWDIKPIGMASVS